MQAFEAYDAFTAHPNQAAWLSVVLRRRLYLCMKEILSNREHFITLTEETLPASMQANEADAMEQLLQDEENRDLVTRLMKPLNDKEKALLRMFYQEQKTSKEIAAIYHTTDRVVNTQLYRIRKKMKKIFESGLFLLICLFRFHI